VYDPFFLFVIKISDYLNTTVRIVKTLLIIFIFCLLTAFTQIGGIIYLVSFATHRYIRRGTPNKWLQQALKFGSFLLLYLLATFLIVPLIAPLFGRVPLPLSETDHLKPVNRLTCLLNRNYVRPELKDAAFSVAEQLNKQYPGTIINYLDACFPFINKFPLLPHLSHNDGKKLDLAFYYIDSRTGKASNKVPSAIGYGISEMPRPGEINTADLCRQKGYWRYSMLTKIVPQGNKIHFTFDSARTKTLVNLFAAQPAIGKIFIEPHLKIRLNLTTPKIRFHGCGAVRHDDHLHVQLK
jgi:hypothetical protein